MTTIVLADDHHIVRAGLRLALEAIEGFKVIGEAGDGLQAIELVRTLCPDVLLVDITMPGADGLEVTRRVTRDCPDTRIVVLSIHRSQVHVSGAFAAGAHAYIMKGAPPTELEKAIRAALSGRRYVSPPAPNHEQATPPSQAAGGAERSGPFTAREEQVLRMLAEGLSSMEIASRLKLSPRTVDVYCNGLMSRLGFTKRAQLIDYAVKRQILDADSGR